MGELCSEPTEHKSPAGGGETLDSSLSDVDNVYIHLQIHVLKTYSIVFVCLHINYYMYKLCHPIVLHCIVLHRGLRPCNLVCHMMNKPPPLEYLTSSL